MRKNRDLTQAQLGSIVGVSQARIAEIEANPGLVSLDQLIQLFSALGVGLSLYDMPLAFDKSQQPQKYAEAADSLKQPNKAVEAADELTQQHKNADAASGLEQIRKLLGHPRKGAW
jgi:transcriptional regulator with XRE-family HTH domain